MSLESMGYLISPRPKNRRQEPLKSRNVNHHRLCGQFWVLLLFLSSPEAVQYLMALLGRLAAPLARSDTTLLFLRAVSEESSPALSALAHNAVVRLQIIRERWLRRHDDIQAAGVVLSGTTDIGMSGNVFSSVRPKAVAIEGDDPVRRVLFSNNVLTDVVSDHGKLKDAEESVVSDNLSESSP